jgi:hypothetical protein
MTLLMEWSVVGGWMNEKNEVEWKMNEMVGEMVVMMK